MRSFARATLENEPHRGLLFWEEDRQVLRLGSLVLNMDNFHHYIHAVLTQLEESARDFLRGFRVAIPELGSLQDDWRCLDKGYSFLRDPRNDKLEEHWMELARFHQTLPLGGSTSYPRLFIRSAQQWSRTACVRWL